MTYNAASLVELKNTEGKYIYCFGAGRRFDIFLNKYSEFKLEYNIKAVVDNNSDKIGITEKVVNDTCIPIISLSQMINDITDNNCILITTDAYEEIIEQLEKIRKLQYINCYIYLALPVEQYDYERRQIVVPTHLSTCKEQQIPKIIHYCWFGKKEIPVQYQKWMKSWRRYCPDYEIIEWNENNYDVHKSRYISQAYEAEQWAFVSDYARIDIINECGGVYLDTDIELIKNIDVMLMNNAFCGFESSQYVAYGLGFGAKRHNPIVGEIKEYYDSTNFVREDGTYDRRSCPMIQTEIMKRHGLKCDGEFQIVDGMTVYPSRVLCGMSPHSFRIERNLEDTYAIHHYAGSWVENRQWKDTSVSVMKKWSRNDNYIYPDI